MICRGDLCSLASLRETFSSSFFFLEKKKQKFKAIAHCRADGSAKAQNRKPLLFITVALKPNQGTSRKRAIRAASISLLQLEKVAESRMRSFSGRLFSFFFGGAKKNEKNTSLHESDLTMTKDCFVPRNEVTGRLRFAICHYTPGHRLVLQTISLVLNTVSFTLVIN